MKTLFTAVIVLHFLSAAGQSVEKKSVVIGSMTTKSDALLIVNPPNSDQGVLLPQLSTGQRMSLKPSSPAEDGLIVFDTNFQTYYYWSNGAWTKVIAAGKRNSYTTIDPSDFQHVTLAGSTRQNYPLMFESDNSFITVPDNAGGEKIIAPVHLPHGAVIEELTIYYMDNDVNNFRISFLRKNLAGDNDNLLDWESSGAVSSIRSETLRNFKGKETVDDENYSYRLLVDFDITPGEMITDPGQAKQRIYGVKIKYQL